MTGDGSVMSGKGSCFPGIRNPAFPFSGLSKRETADYIEMVLEEPITFENLRRKTHQDLNRGRLYFLRST